MLLNAELLIVKNYYHCNLNFSSMSNHLKFIVLHREKFVYIDNEWKWKGNKITSIVVPTSITLARLVLRLKDELSILDFHTQVELKCKVSNTNIPHSETYEDEDLNWYISVHKKSVICVTILESEFLIVYMGMDANFQNPSFVAWEVYRNVQHDEIDQM